MSARCKLFFALFSLAAGAAALHGQSAATTSFRPKRASEYPSKQKLGKLTIAAVKYESDEETRTAFGKVNPNEYGVLPILLIMENEGDQTLLVDRMKVMYQVPRREEVQPMNPADLPMLVGPKRPNTGMKYPSPIPLPKKKNPLSAVELQTRAFSAKTILPKDAASGFLYFETRHQRNAILYITGIREGGTGQDLFFVEVPIDTP